MKPLTLLGMALGGLAGMIWGLDYMQKAPQREQARWDARYRESQEPIVMEVSRDYWGSDGNYIIEGSAEGWRINSLTVLNGGVGEESRESLDERVEKGSKIKFPAGNLRQVEPLIAGPGEKMPYNGPELYGYSPLPQETVLTESNPEKGKKYSPRITVLNNP